MTGQQDPSAAAEQDKQALNDAWMQVTGTTMSDEVLADRLRQGWSLPRVHWLGRLAEHASSVRAAIAGSAFDASAQGVAFWLGRTANRALSQPQCAFADLGRWLVVLASDPDENRSIGLRSGLQNWSPYDGVGWRTRTAGSYAALTWAAGLPQAEAAEQHVAGGLDVEALRTLAGLRGFRLPSPAVAVASHQRFCRARRTGTREYRNVSSCGVGAFAAGVDPGPGFLVQVGGLVCRVRGAGLRGCAVRASPPLAPHRRRPR